MKPVADWFLDNELIGDDEAPEKILKRWRDYETKEASRYSMCSTRETSYHAELKKRFWGITPDDFLKYARRFAVLCGKVYRVSEVKLQGEAQVPLDNLFSGTFPPPIFMFPLFVLLSPRRWELDVNQITADNFYKVFELSSRVMLLVKTDVLIKNSFTGDERNLTQVVEWDHLDPKRIFFEQAGDEDKLRGKQLEELFLRKMFYVPGVAPSFNFWVKPGQFRGMGL